MTMKVLLIAIVVIVAMGLLFYYSIASSVRYRVEVCVAYNGRTSCRTARADTQDHALHSAQSNACALIASGVTETMGCERSTPTSVKWLDNK